MEDHPLIAAPDSKKPYLSMSYYAYQEWLQVVNSDRLTNWEIIRFKNIHETYILGRAFLQIPVIGVSYYLSHFIVGPPIFRGTANFRETLVFGLFIYAYLHHYIDNKRIPNANLDELFTQSTPNGAYLRKQTREFMPGFWTEIEEQLKAKGHDFSNET